MEIEGFRLSPQQRRLWNLQQDSSCFNAVLAIAVEGETDPKLLEESLRGVALRHGILRSTFRRLEGMKVPLQVIGESGEVRWQTINLGHLCAQDQDAEIHERFEEEKQFSFELRQGPLLRAALFILSPLKHVLLLSLPSLCADSWTLKNLFRDIGDCYNARTGSDEDAPEVVQYVQFSEWQNELLEDGGAETDKEFCSGQGPADRLALTLPFERRGATSGEFKPQLVAAKLDSKITAGIEKLSRDHNTAESTILLASWQVLLWRITRQPHIVTAFITDGRKFEQLHGAAGLFAGWLPVECDLDGQERFIDVLSRVSQAVQDGEEYNLYSCDAEGAESFSGIAVPSVIFEYVEWPASYRVAGASFSILDEYTCAEPFKIKLSCARSKGSLTAALHYDSRVLSPENMDRLAGQFHRLLESAVGEPDAPIEALQIVSGAELRRILFDLNGNNADSTPARCLHQLFEEQVELNAESISVIFEQEQVTYAELNRRSNRLGHYLQSLGVGPEKPVGICVKRSIDMVVSILGTLKAGGLYVPIDATYPKERLGLILDESCVSVLLTHQDLLGALPDHSAGIVCMDKARDEIARHGDHNVSSGVRPDNLAYMIYTSGSTGKPKGVMITHAGLFNYLNWCARVYDVASGKGSPVHSPIGFDLTVTSLFPPLISGRTVKLLNEDRGVEALKEALLTGEEYSLLKVTPAHLEALSQLLSGDGEVRARALVIGGEALLAESLGYWQAKSPSTRLINEYGPTETVVGCCVYEVARGESITGAVPIGKPIANTQIYLLDKFMGPAAIGEPGEIYVGGAGVARGYHNQPGMTAESFLPDPFGLREGERLYKTGDYGRYLDDGNIQFLGRADGQVKIRGYRVEVSEIEALMARHPSIKEAAVLMAESPPGDKRLTAYFVPRGKEALTAGELRSHLSGALPDYMVPSNFIALESMPLTPNGKVDRRALLTAKGKKSSGRTEYRGSATGLEQTIARIWEAVLQVEKPGMDDNFFDLGGHSLLMVKVYGKLREEIDAEISLVDLFEYPTIASLATFISREDKAARPELKLEEQKQEKLAEGKNRLAQQLRHRQQVREII